MDNLKVFLTILVILHHSAITYGADGSWFYSEVKQTQMPDSLLLTLFVAFNQSFFMGLFFFISGCFVMSSLQRKTVVQFLEDKLIRLAIPVALFLAVVYPVTVWVAYYPHSLDSFKADMPQLFSDFSLAHSGPTWFVLVLFLFNLVALILRKPLAKLFQKPLAHDGATLFALSICMGLVSFLVRLVCPDGFTVLNVQLSYMPQYLVYFFAGVILGGQGAAQLAKSQQIKHWLIPAAVCFCLLVMALGIAGDTTPFKGGFNPWAIFYSFVQGFHSIAFSVIFMVLFYRHANRCPWMRAIPGRAAYGAFFIHSPVIVTIAIILQSLVLPPLVKFFLLALLGVPASFALGYLLARLPMLRKVF